MTGAPATCLSVAAAIWSTTALGSSPSGFPPGVWRLNESNSKSMGARSQTLEIVRDDGQSLSFVLRQKDIDGTTSVLRWSGQYGDPPHSVEGGEVSLAVAHGPDHSIRIFGQRTGGINYQEICRVAPNKRRFRCDGSQWGDNLPRNTYVEIYDLQP